MGSWGEMATTDVRHTLRFVQKTEMMISEQKYIDQLRITPQSLFSGPPDQSTWMFLYSSIQEWLGRVFWYAVLHYTSGLLDQKIIFLGLTWTCLWTPWALPPRLLSCSWRRTETKNCKVCTFCWAKSNSQRTCNQQRGKEKLNSFEGWKKLKKVHVCVACTCVHSTVRLFQKRLIFENCNFSWFVNTNFAIWSKSLSLVFICASAKF